MTSAQHHRPDGLDRLDRLDLPEGLTFTPQPFQETNPTSPKQIKNVQTSSNRFRVGVFTLRGDVSAGRQTPSALLD